MEAFAELIRRARSSDENAWEEIFSRLGDERAEGAVLLAMARKLLPAGDRARDFVESRDLMQSALRSGWFDLSGFQGSTEKELFAWMRAILRRKLSRVVRRQRPRPGDAPPALEEDARRDLPGEPLSEMIRDEVRARVRAAVRRLPEDQREVMELRLRGLGAPDIALMLGLKADAVRKRESRAAERLREMLE
jgi:RNA polymerase sigma factor (sigma-70 family)